VNEINVIDLDLIDAVCFCYAGLAQDKPYDETHYLNATLNILYGYLDNDQRKEVDEYLAEKKYLPTLPTIEIAK
tara:strand:+ start:204 stop:425 length:222 start_codon:yes stop_codon:yes gene_type:complete